MKKISICIPVVRVEKPLECIEAIHQNAGIARSRYEIITAVDTERIGCPRMLKKLVERAKYGLICFLGDDTIPQPDFLKNALKAMKSLPDGWGVVGLNSGGNDHAHFFADRRILKHIPGGDFFSTEFEHCFGDDELKDIAMEQGRWAYAEDALIEHVHPIFGKAEYDEHYQGAYSDGKFERDRRTYQYRKIDRRLALSGPLVGFGFPLTDLRVYSHFMFSFLQMSKPDRYCLYFPDYPGNHDAVRNNLVQQASIDGCTHLFMMDTDQIYSSVDMVQRMMAHDKPVVVGRVHRRYPPFDPILLRGKVGSFEPVPTPEIELARSNGNPLVEVDATGCGCVLYDMRVFADIPYPWFELTISSITGRPVGEDIGFCAKLKKYGYRIYVDCSVEIQHLSLHATDWNTFKVWEKMHEKKDVNLQPQKARARQ